MLKSGYSEVQLSVVQRSN